MVRWWFMVGLLASGLPAFANEKFSIDGDTVIYDTENLDEEAEISSSDVDDLRDLLRANPEVTRLALNSAGGGYFAGLNLGRLVADFEIDTHIINECSSSCFYVFLGGVNRTMARGAELGLHHTSWSAESIEGYFEDEQESSGWANPFDMTEELYIETQMELYDELIFVVSRGVDPEFAIESIRVRRDGLWYPTRQKLRAAGVLTE